jgi:hypothetical protein
LRTTRVGVDPGPSKIWIGDVTLRRGDVVKAIAIEGS